MFEQVICIIIAFALTQQLHGFQLFSRPFAMQKFSYRGINDNHIQMYRLLGGTRKMIVRPDTHELAHISDSEDLADDDENRDYLMGQFQSLAAGKGSISKSDFLQWEEMQQLIKDDIISTKEIEEIWTRRAAGDQIDVDAFLVINDDIDELLHIESGEDESSFEEGTTDNEKSSVWFPEVNVESLFENEFLQYLSSSFDQLTEGRIDKQLTFLEFSRWKDIAVLVENGQLQMEVLQAAWKEAINYQYPPENPSERQYLDMTISRDTFYRLSYRLDDMMEQFQQALLDLTENDAEKFYRSEFQTLTRGGKYLTYEALMRWPFLQETFKMNPELFTVENLREIWEEIPKSLNEYGERSITESDFLVLNEAIDDAVMTVEVKDSKEISEANILQ